MSRLVLKTKLSAEERSARLRQKEFSNGHVGGFLIALAILPTLAATLFFYQRISSTGVVRAQAGHQHRTTQPKRRSKTPARATTNPRSSNFKHEDHRAPKAKLSCSDCHIIAPPKPNVVAAAATTEVKSYPYHDKCLSCHRVTPPQLFRGATPVICAVCHTRSGPGLTKRDMNPFPKQSAQLILGDLSLKFNHESTNHRHDCTSCHLNVAQLDLAKADVPISTCATSQCHRKQNVQPGFDQQMLLLEDDDIAGGENRHTCIGCHSTAIGGTPPPCTHYKLFDIAYFTVTDFPKGAKVISEQCK